MDFFYACKAGISGGLARCRNQEGHCPSHPATKSWPSAPRPTVVLVKFNLSDRWRDIFALDCNVPIEDRSYGRRRMLEGKHVEQAESFGRQAYVARLQTGEHEPEKADSGSPVFGESGLTGAKVGIDHLINELSAAGFLLSRLSVLERTNKRPVLITEWSAAKVASFDDQFTKAFDRFTSATFDQIHIWANPTDANGKTVHTVNCGARQEVPPQHTLRFANGDWAVEPIAAPATAA
jgi:hypothetical protein